MHAKDERLIMIEVFRTNVRNPLEASVLASALRDFLPCKRVSFDLEDCDRILRIESNTSFNADVVIRWLEKRGYWSEVLPDIVVPMSV